MTKYIILFNKLKRNIIYNNDRNIYYLKKSCLALTYVS